MTTFQQRERIKGMYDQISGNLVQLLDNLSYIYGTNKVEHNISKYFETLLRLLAPIQVLKYYESVEKNRHIFNPYLNDFDYTNRKNDQSQFHNKYQDGFIDSNNFDDSRANLTFNDYDDQPNQNIFQHSQNNTHFNGLYMNSHINNMQLNSPGQNYNLKDTYTEKRTTKKNNKNSKKNLNQKNQINFERSREKPKIKMENQKIWEDDNRINYLKSLGSTLNSTNKSQQDQPRMQLIQQKLKNKSIKNMQMEQCSYSAHSKQIKQQKQQQNQILEKDQSVLSTNLKNNKSKRIPKIKTTMHTQIKQPQPQNSLQNLNKQPINKKPPTKRPQNSQLSPLSPTANDKTNPTTKRNKINTSLSEMQENQLCDWICEQIKSQKIINQYDIMFQARKLARDGDFQASSGWLKRFLERNQRAKNALKIFHYLWSQDDIQDKKKKRSVSQRRYLSDSQISSQLKNQNNQQDFQYLRKIRNNIIKQNSKENAENQDSSQELGVSYYKHLLKLQYQNKGVNISQSQSFEEIKPKPRPKVQQQQYKKDNNQMINQQNTPMKIGSNDATLAKQPNKQQAPKQTPLPAYTDKKTKSKKNFKIKQVSKKEEGSVNKSQYQKQQQQGEKDKQKEIYFQEAIYRLQDAVSKHKTEFLYQQKFNKVKGVEGQSA